MDEDNFVSGSLIPVFFVDLICRILPGTIMVAMYIGNTKNCLESNFIFLSVLIAFGYIAGFTLDISGELFFHYLSKNNRFNTLIKNHKNKLGCDKYSYQSTKYLIKEIDEMENKQAQNLMKKMLAECCLFRSLFIMCLVLLITAHLLLYFNIYFIFIAAGIFFMCHIIRNLKVQERLDSVKAA